MRQNLLEYVIRHRGGQAAQLVISRRMQGDLVIWIKHGSAFAGTSFENLRMKSAAIVHKLRDGRLVAAKIDGKYWMYFGEHAVGVATAP